MPSEPSPTLGSPLLLLVAVAVLGLGPLFFVLARRWRWLLPFVDGFVLASVGVLAGLFVLPAAVREAGPWAIVAAGAGLLLPSFLEDVSTRRRLIHGVGIALALGGLLVHTLTDGMALVTASADDRALVLAVILHRIPVGLAAWWIVRPLYGLTGAWVVLALEAGGTVLGFVLGGTGALALEGTSLELLQAFVAGALLHVVLHRHPTDNTPRRWHVSETLGALLGGALVAFVPHHHEEQEPAAHAAHGHAHGVEGDPIVGEYATRFLALTLDVAPYLLIGIALATALVLVLPRAPLTGGPKGRLVLALRGTVFGLSLPACSDGVLSTYRHLRARGAPAIAALAFLYASPVLGVESLLLSVPLLGVGLSSARLAGGVLLALALGLVVVRVLRPEPDEASTPLMPSTPSTPSREDAAEAEEDAPRKPLTILRRALREVLDESAAWILLGLAVAAAVAPATGEGWLAQLSPGVDVVLAALVAAPVYLNASGATPLAAALVIAGASPGAALAFLLMAPATSVTTLGVLGRLHGRTAAASFAALVLGGAIVLGWSVNAIAPSLAVALDVESAATPLGYAALLVLAALYGGALLRQGPRRFLGGVLSSEHVHDDGMPHAHDHGHLHVHFHGEGHHDGHHHDHHHGHRAHGHAPDDHAHEGHAHDSPSHAHDHDHHHDHDDDAHDDDHAHREQTP